MKYIGIDLGTSGCKLLLVESDGKILNTVTKEYPLYFPNPGWSEQNPSDWITAIKDGIKDLVKETNVSDIKGIGVGGQMHGLVTLDENDEVIRPAILWNDGRTENEVEYLNQEIGKDRISEYTANIAFAGFTAPKIIWMKKNEPDNFVRIKKIMLPKDYVNYVLTGEFTTDVSDASGMLLMDVKNKCWSGEMLKLCDITEDKLATIHESYEVVGGLKPDMARQLALPQGIKVVAGASDNAAAAVGTGTVGEGACNISVGTSGTLFISSESFGVDSNNALHSFAHADGKYHLMGCMLSAASCNKWLMEDIFKTEDFAGEQAGITDDMLGNNHVYFLPYLMGERSPINDVNARATFIGMTMDTSRSDMTLAMLEGIAFAIRDSLEIAKKLGIDVVRSNICGGGSKSPLWKKIFANVLNIKLDIIETEEGPGFGGAILAMVGCGEYADVESACKKLVKIVDTIEPDPEIAARYEKRYAGFSALYPALKDVFTKL